MQAFLRARLFLLALAIAAGEDVTDLELAAWPAGEPGLAVA